MVKQLKITDFFEHRRKTVTPNHRLRQTILTDFFRSSAFIKQQKHKRKKRYDKTYYRDVRLFRAQIEQQDKLTFLTSKGGFIYATSANYSFHAYCAKSHRRVATAEVDDGYYLEHIEVKPDYRRRGIGLQLIRSANIALKGKLVVCGGIDQNSRYRLTNEGAALINACLDKGLLKDDQVIPDLPTSPTCGVF